MPYTRDDVCNDIGTVVAVGVTARAGPPAGMAAREICEVVRDRVTRPTRPSRREEPSRSDRRRRVWHSRGQRG